MTRALHIGPGMTFPLDAITRTFGILAQRGAGKTHCASVLVEEMLANQLPVVVLDPTGAWWGLRTSADGKKPGLAITILGGQHGDLPLESTGGAIVADFVVDERVSLVLDLSAFSIGEQRRFVTDFAERLYKRNGQPLHIVIDEADEFCSQKIPHGHERMAGAIDRLVRRGRIKGLGVTMISQRSAVIAKDVLTQIDTLIVLRTTGPQDRAAIDAWVSQNGTPQQRTELLESLSSLPTGTAWVWSPSWLSLFKRVHVRARTTFDSSATPKVGQDVKAPRVLASVDLEQIRARMSETVERAKAEDPKELRRQLAEVRRELDAALARPTEPMAEPTIVNRNVYVLPEGFMTEVRSLTERLERTALQITTTVANAMLAPARPPVIALPRQTPASVAPKRAGIVVHTVQGDGKLAGGERKIMTALAQYPAGRTRTQVAILTGYAVSGGGFLNYLGALRKRGLIVGSDAMRITLMGSEALGEFDPLPTGGALLTYWYGKLGKAERSVLEVLAGEFPRALDKASIASQTGYAVDGGGFANALGKLRTLELITGRAEMRASESFFDVGKWFR